MVATLVRTSRADQAVAAGDKRRDYWRMDLSSFGYGLVVGSTIGLIIRIIFMP